MYYCFSIFHQYNYSDFARSRPNVEFNIPVISNHSKHPIFYAVFSPKSLIRIYTYIFSLFAPIKSLYFLEHLVQVVKSFNHDNIVYAFYRNKSAKLYLPSTLQTLDIELLNP